MSPRLLPGSKGTKTWWPQRLLWLDHWHVTMRYPTAVQGTSGWDVWHKALFLNLKRNLIDGWYTPKHQWGMIIIPGRDRTKNTWNHQPAFLYVTVCLWVGNTILKVRVTTQRQLFFGVQLLCTHQALWSLFHVNPTTPDMRRSLTCSILQQKTLQINTPKQTYVHIYIYIYVSLS